MAFGFASCNNNEVEVKKTYSDEEILSAIKFVGQGVLPQNNPSLRAPSQSNTELTSASVVIRIARKSTGCASGFGFCEVVKIAENELAFADANTIYLPVEQVDFDNFSLELAEKPQIDMTNVRFSVDEDVYVEDNGIICAKVQANEYKYDETVGTAGGFRLISESLK